MADQAELHAAVEDQRYKGWTIRWRGWIYPPYQVAITGHWIAWKDDDPRLTVLAIGVGEKLQKAAYNGVAGWGLMTPCDYVFTGMEAPAVLLTARTSCLQRLLRAIDAAEDALTHNT